MCKMFDYEKHIEYIIRETLAWAEGQVVPEEIKLQTEEEFNQRGFDATIGFNDCLAQIINSFKEIQGL